MTNKEIFRAVLNHVQENGKDAEFKGLEISKGIRLSIQKVSIKKTKDSDDKD